MFLYTGVFYPRSEGVVAGNICGQIEYQCIGRRIVGQTTYQFNQGIAERYDHLAVIAATSRLLLLETECPCGIIHIAVCKSADIAIPYPCEQSE